MNDPIQYYFKETQRKKTPSNKTPAITKSTNRHLISWYVKEVLKLKQNFQKNIVVTCKTSFFMIGPFCTHHSICPNVGFWYGSFVWK